LNVLSNVRIAEEDEKKKIILQNQVIAFGSVTQRNRNESNFFLEDPKVAEQSCANPPIIAMLLSKNEFMLQFSLRNLL